MQAKECRYQAKVTLPEIVSALSEARCYRCSIPASELMMKGELLEVCGEEHYSDPATGERVLMAVALCPECHRKNHLDARRHHHPCQVQARLSREGLV